METKSDSVVIIPMYNERENAAAIIDAVMELPVRFDVLVVGDSLHRRIPPRPPR